MAGLEPHHRQRSLIGVAGIGKGNLGLRLGQLRLGELNNAAQADLVSCLRKIEGHVRFVQHLLRHADPLERVLRVQHSSTQIARDLVAQVAHLFAGCIGAQFCLLRARVEEKPVKEGNVDVCAGSAVPAGLNLIGAYGRGSRRGLR